MYTDHTTTKRIALVVLTRAGLALALRLRQGLATDVHIYASPRAFPVGDVNQEGSKPLSYGPLPMAEECLEHSPITRFEAVAPLLSQLWTTYDQIVLFFALGAVVRLIAPLLRHKYVDPGIVAIDDTGRFAISVVSGHIGGANELALRCAEVLGAISVVTTASDVHNTLAVDLLAYTQGWRVEDTSAMTAVSAAIVNGEAVAILHLQYPPTDRGNEENQTSLLASPEEDNYNRTTLNISSTEERKTPPYDPLPSGGTQDPSLHWPGNFVHVTNPQDVSATRFAALLVVSDRLIEGLPQDVPTLVYRPPTLVLGVGCRRGVSFDTLDTFVKETLAEHRVAFQSVALLATADIKADETALQMLVQRYDWGFETHTVTVLRTMTGVPNPSEHVQRLIGTPSVCEAAALLSSNGGTLIVSKQKGEGMTLAVARKGGNCTRGGASHAATARDVPPEEEG